MKKINSDQICSINKIFKKRYPWYVYKKEWTLFNFLSLRKEGFYDINVIGNDVYTSNEDILKDDELYVENKNVYFKPHVNITMSNGGFHRKFFETEDELNIFVYNLTNRNNWIKIND